jgi:hypothetical protein
VIAERKTRKKDGESSLQIDAVSRSDLAIRTPNAIDYIANQTSRMRRNLQKTQNGQEG